MPSSPLHAAFPEHDGTRDCAHHTSSPALGDASAPASGIGSQRSRRLQLRNAGFRGPTLPARNVTPKSLPSISRSSTNPTSSPPVFSMGQQSQSFDAENISPSGKTGTGETHAGFGSTRESSGILQPIENSSANSAGTLKQVRRVRPRVTSNGPEMSGSNNNHSSLTSPTDYSSAASPHQPNNTQPRSTRTKRAAITGSVQSRRSVSGETRKYVDHLEAELQTAQSQLQAVNAPSVTREHSATIRHLKAEARQLQEEVAAWESKYDERVQEAVQTHFEMEASLRAKVRNLEQEAEETAYRVRELEYQLSNATQNLESIESANVNLEKRLEIMSELLACSPTRIDLAAETPGRHGRPKSVVIPRFPTASALMSPERLTRQTSPFSSPSQTKLNPGIPISPLNLAFSPEISSSGDESHTYDALMYTTSVVGPPKSKPMRRMRRFGAGSIGPKALILPSTSHPQHEQMPASTPPLEHSAFPREFPFERNFALTDSWEDSLDTRCRAPGQGGSQPPLDADIDCLDDALGGAIDMQCPRSRNSTPHSRDLGSIGSHLSASLGRNLMEELTAARNSSSVDGSDETQLVEDIADEGPPRFVSNVSTAIVTNRPPQLMSMSGTRASSKPLGVPSYNSLSILDGLRDFFGDMVHSPLALVKHLIERAQARSWIPRPLLNIQWWLVGILLGPMAKKRLLAQSKKPCCLKVIDSGERGERHLDESPNEHPGESDLAYGALYQTPPSSSPSAQSPFSSCSVAGKSSTSRNRSLVAGKGKKRSPSISSKSMSARAKNSCPNENYHHQRHKHSPLLWLKFSMTLAIAVGIAFKDGPSSLLKEAICECRRRRTAEIGSGNWRGVARDGSILGEERVIGI